MRVLLLIILFSPLTVLGEEIDGSGWVFEENDGDKKIILFDPDKTFTYINITSSSGNSGRTFSGTRFQWSFDGTTVVLNFNNNFRLCSLNLKGSDTMIGTCVNEKGVADSIKGKLIE
tara:strand:- start:343 stop:693 length:351 start_codon:yes stop_codon:yes gene_type:complete